MMLERITDARLKALAEAAETYVDEAFGEHLALIPIAPKALPHFILDRYSMWQGQLQGRNILLMAIREVLPTGSGATAQYLKHRDLVRREFSADLVLLLLDRASGAIRRQLMERKIGFLAPGAQIYVPEVFLDLRERAPAFAIAHGESISPTTQMLIIALLLRKVTEDGNLTGLANEMGVSWACPRATYASSVARDAAAVKHDWATKKGSGLATAPLRSLPMWRALRRRPNRCPP